MTKTVEYVCTGCGGSHWREPVADGLTCPDCRPMRWMHRPPLRGYRGAPAAPMPAMPDLFGDGPLELFA